MTADTALTLPLRVVKGRTISMPGHAPTKGFDVLDAKGGEIAFGLPFEAATAIVEAVNGRADLLNALRPFARFNEGFGPHGREDGWVLCTNVTRTKAITMGDVREAARVCNSAARAALSGEQP